MNIALILAGGAGVRAKGDKPKQFIDINGIPMLIRTINCFKQVPQIDSICVVVPKEYITLTENMMHAYNTSVDYLIAGGNDRRESSYIGVKYLSDIFTEEDIVLIHDGARPNVNQQIITDNINVAERNGAAVTAIRGQDTLLIGDCENNVAGYVNRENAYMVQTPQSFRLGLIKHAHEKIKEEIIHGKIDPEEITDDSRIAVLAENKVTIVAGDKFNIKVTTQEDFGIICNIMK